MRFKNLILSFILLAGIFVFNRCSNEVDLYAEYQDITIVYGILDFAEDTTWLKITKAFTGPGDALQMAKNPDSSNYPYKLDVAINGRKSGHDLTPIVFDTLTIRNKRPGDSIFYFPNQLMYYAAAEIDEDAEYTLEILKDGSVINAETKLVNSFSITSPKNRINFTTDGTIEWRSARNGKRYEAYYIFNYTELLPGSSDTTKHQVLYTLGVSVSKSLNGGEEMGKGYSGDLFYNRLNAQLEKIPNVKRWAGDINMIISSGSQVLQNYLAINNATSSILQEVPIYSNIENGTGIFASRHNANRSVQLSTRSLDKLVNDYDLGFMFPTK